MIKKVVVMDCMSVKESTLKVLSQEYNRKNVNSLLVMS